MKAITRPRDVDYYVNKSMYVVKDNGEDIYLDKEEFERSYYIPWKAVDHPASYQTKCSNIYRESQGQGDMGTQRLP